MNLKTIAQQTLFQVIDRADSNQDGQVSQAEALASTVAGATRDVLLEVLDGQDSRTIDALQQQIARFANYYTDSLEFKGSVETEGIDSFRKYGEALQTE
jgi:hypothetical protein